LGNAGTPGQGKKIDEWSLPLLARGYLIHPKNGKGRCGKKERVVAQKRDGGRPPRTFTPEKPDLPTQQSRENKGPFVVGRTKPTTCKDQEEKKEVKKALFFGGGRGGSGKKKEGGGKRQVAGQ